MFLDRFGSLSSPYSFASFSRALAEKLAALYACLMDVFCVRAEGLTPWPPMPASDVCRCRQLVGVSVSGVATTLKGNPYSLARSKMETLTWCFAVLGLWWNVCAVFRHTLDAEVRRLRGEIEQRESKTAESFWQRTVAADREKTRLETALDQAQAKVSKPTRRVYMLVAAIVYHRRVRRI